MPCGPSNVRYWPPEAEHAVCAVAELAYGLLPPGLALPPRPVVTPLAVTQMLTAGPPSAPAAVAMNKGAAAPAHKAATLPKARILLAPNTLTSCFEPPQGNAAERTLTYEEPRRSPHPRIWPFSRPSFVPHTEPEHSSQPASRDAEP